MVGWLQLDTDEFKLSLRIECSQWKRAFGAALNRRASGQMEDVFVFVDAANKRLQRPITDLDDVRAAMATLREVTHSGWRSGFELHWLLLT